MYFVNIINIENTVITVNIANNKNCPLIPGDNIKVTHT